MPLFKRLQSHLKLNHTKPTISLLGSLDPKRPLMYVNAKVLNRVKINCTPLFMIVLNYELSRLYRPCIPSPEAVNIEQSCTAFRQFQYATISIHTASTLKVYHTALPIKTICATGVQLPFYCLECK